MGEALVEVEINQLAKNLSPPPWMVEPTSFIIASDWKRGREGVKSELGEAGERLDTML